MNRVIIDTYPMIFAGKTQRFAIMLKLLSNGYSGTAYICLDGNPLLIIPILNGDAVNSDSGVFVASGVANTTFECTESDTGYPAGKLFVFELGEALTVDQK